MLHLLCPSSSVKSLSSSRTPLESKVLSTLFSYTTSVYFHSHGKICDFDVHIVIGPSRRMGLRASEHY